MIHARLIQTLSGDLVHIPQGVVTPDYLQELTWRTWQHMEHQWVLTSSCEVMPQVSLDDITAMEMLCRAQVISG